jgi:predicted dehydrogenase
MAVRSPLRIAIVGAGLMGRWHAYYAGRLGARIVGVVDRDSAKAGSLLQDHKGASFYSELEACLSQSKPDVVHICTPSTSHFDLARVALESDAHVLIEKPAATTFEDTEELLRLARYRKRLLTPVHQFPFQNGFAQLRRNAAQLGQAVRVTYEAYTAGGAGASEEQRRQILTEILPHPFSLGSSLFGTSFLKTLEPVGPQTCDDMEFAGMAGDTRFHVSVSHRGRPTRNVLSYIGTAGSAHVNLFHGFAVFETGSEVSRRKKMLQPLGFGARLVARSSANLATRLRRSIWAYPGLAELGSAFYDAVRTGGAAPIADSEVLEIARTVERLRPQ